MSIVGPRPCIPYEVEYFKAHHVERFFVPQGITGLWQVQRESELDVRRGPRHGRRLCARLVTGARSPAAVPDPVRAPSAASGDRMSQPVRVAVVGLGYWGPNLVRNLAELDGAELVAICDLDPERLALIGRRYPAVRRTTDVAGGDLRRRRRCSLDRDARFDPSPASGWQRSTPASTCSSRSRLRRRLPRARSSRRSRRGWDACSCRGTPSSTAPRSSPSTTSIASGALGELLFVSSSRVNLGLHQSDVSVVWDLAPHDFSILRYWLGETPAYVSATARACVGDLPDVAFIDLEFDSGPIAHVELSWLAPSKLRRTTIVGSEKMVVYDDTSNRAGPRVRFGRAPS